jgi:DNA-binding transcriptional regulator YhcF (GntR family)
MIGARPNDLRGRALRASLTQLVRSCAVNRRPLPSHRDIAAMMGVSAPQITRHLNRMMDEGVFTPVCRHTRMYVGDVA